MSTAPLYREVRLLINDPDDVAAAENILRGKLTVSQNAESRGQEMTKLFDGDGDVLILSYTLAAEGTSKEKAASVIGRAGSEAVRKVLCRALAESKLAIEVVFRYCNLDSDAVTALADAVRENKHLVGFSVIGNPGNDKDGERALRRACMETLAPIQWFQGQCLSDGMRQARRNHVSIREHILSGGNHSSSSSSPDRQVAIMQAKERLFLDIDDEEARDRKIDQIGLSDLDSKLKNLLSIG